MATISERGSDKLLDKLFAQGASEEELLAALGSHTRASGLASKFILTKGQPVPDEIIAVLHAKPNMAAPVVDSLIKLANENLRVKAEVFPLGIPVPDLAEINVTLQRNIPRKG